MPISLDARIDSRANVSPDVDIGAFSIVHAGVFVGSGSRIGSFCEIGLPTTSAVGQQVHIGDRANIRSHAVVYAGTSIGADFESGHHVTIREGAVIGNGVRIGTLSDIQGDCEIGDHVRMHSSVFVAKGSDVRRFAWLLPRVVLTNDPTPPSNEHAGCVVDEYAVIAASALLMPGVHVGIHALVAAGACVTADVPPHMVAMGVPAKVVGPTSSVRLRGSANGAAYPWTRHFHRGYPPDLVRQWISVGAQAENSDAP